MKRRRTHKLEIHSCCCDTCDIVRSSIYILNLKQCSYSHTHDCLFLASRARSVREYAKQMHIIMCSRLPLPSSVEAQRRRRRLRRHRRRYIWFDCFEHYCCLRELLSKEWCTVWWVLHHAVSTRTNSCTTDYFMDVVCYMNCTLCVRVVVVFESLSQAAQRAQHRHTLFIRRSQSWFLSNVSGDMKQHLEHLFNLLKVQHFVFRNNL